MGAGGPSHRKIQGERFEFPGPKVYWLETYTPAGRNDSSPNDMWKKRVRGQLEKCAEASALRVAFPEELGTDYIQEEQYAPSANAKEIADTIAGVIPPAPPQPLNTITAALEAELTPTADEIGAAPEPETGCHNRYHIGNRSTTCQQRHRHTQPTSRLALQIATVPRPPRRR